MDNQQQTAHFVPFCDTVIERYPNVHALPPHNVMDRKLCHGEIRLTLTAKSPLMVGGGNTVSEEGNSITLFDRDPQGRCRIPGSSMRGLIRQNMQILGLGIVRVSRVDEINIEQVYGNRNPVDGLPQSYRIPDDRDLLDYPRSIMGYVGRKHLDKSFRKPRNVIDCYRSRISFGDLTAVGTPTELQAVLIQQKLPQQADQKFIIQEPGQRFRLAGTRQYPLRETLVDPSPDSTQGFRPLEAGTQFTGTIRYRNLHEDELGLLLWCLRLESGCCHTIGMAKEHGYGQVQMRIDQLLEFDPGQLYSSLTAGPVTRGAQRVEELIAAYQRYACAQKNVSAPGGSLRQMPHIRTFLQMKGWTDADK